MIYTITNTEDEFFSLLAQDPVRPSIPHQLRVGPNRDVLVYRDEAGEVKAITCISYQKSIPMAEGELFEPCSDPEVAVFYTIWSYVAGAGRTLIFDAVRHIQQTRPNIRRFVTLSPKTDMAQRFHIRNGAVVFRENPETVNYEYVEVDRQY